MALQFSDPEIQLINIYIGLIIRHARLSANISQYDVAIKCGIDSTAIGRIERAEHICNWSSLYLLCKTLKIDLSSLFVLKDEKEFLSIINQCHLLESKLNNDRNKYYKKLSQKVQKLFKLYALN